MAVDDFNDALDNTEGSAPAAGESDAENDGERDRKNSAGGDADNAIDRLVDVLELVRALAEDVGVTPDQLEEVRAAKEADRGGFTDKIVWCGNHPTEEPAKDPAGG